MSGSRPSCPTCADLEAQLADARGQLVAMERLHEGVERAEVLAAIQDVVINIVGSEELAVFELRDGGWLHPVQSFGLDGARLAPVRVGQGPVGRAAAERRAWVIGDAGPRPDDAALSAVVPLAGAAGLFGVLAIWRMLPQKPLLGPAERDVLGLLARHAGNALHHGSARRAA